MSNRISVSMFSLFPSLLLVSFLLLLFLFSVPVFAQEEESGLGRFSRDASEIPAEVYDTSPTSLSRTSLAAWAPTGSVRFKTSASCHMPAWDYYAIFAVFEMSDGTEELWYLQIDGMSSMPEYGHLVLTSDTPIATEDSIDHVDAACDDYYAYVVWDRSNSTEVLHAQWARASSITGNIYGPYTLPDCRFYVHPDYDPSPFETAIAQHDGIIAISSRSVATCGVCFDLFNTNGTLRDHVGYSQIWGGSPTSTGIEWNNDGSFLAAIQYRLDGPPPEVYTVLLDPDGTVHSPCGIACTVYQSTTTTPDQELELIYSPHTWNLYDLMVIQIDYATIWTYQDGREVNSSNNPQNVGPWLDYARASCECWVESGTPRYRIAHTYAGSGLYTRHHHWNYWPTSAREVYDFHSLYWPDSCASSDGYDDAEILLTSRTIWYYGRERIYYNIEDQD